MRATRRPARGGYTILEVLLASTIAAFLLGGLYVSLDLTLVRMDVNRDLVATNDLSRAIANRLNGDLAATLGPLPPRSGGDTGTAQSTTTTTTSTPAATTGTTGTGTGTADAAATDAAAAPAAESATIQSDYPLGMGVVGSESQLTLFTSRVPGALLDAEALADPNALLPGDLKRVTYYLASDGRGLCRQERPWVTADGVRNSADPDRTDEAIEVIAPEVVGLSFEYYDGGTWQSSWDGSTTGTDGTSLTGPPRAVRVTVTLEFPGQAGPVTRTVTHTVAVRAAVGAYLPETTTSSGSATPATTTGTTTTGGN